MGGVANFVGDTISSVIDTVTDHPLETAVLIAAPYLAGELLAGEAIGAGGAGILGADIAGVGSIGYVPGAEAAATFSSGGGLSGALFGTIPEVTAGAIAEGASAVPIATQGYLGAGGVFNPLTGSISNLIPSTPTDFLTSFIPKTPADIAQTLGTSALLSTAANALIPKPAVAGVNMNIPQSNIPQYGTGKTIFDAYNSAKQGVNNILYPQGLLGTQQPRTAGIYSNYLQQQGLI
jgi:hypothetical protein